MRNQIDLGKYEVRTDLMIDNKIEESNIEKRKVQNHLEVTTIEVTKELGIKLQKKEGIYVTIEFEDITNHEDKQAVEDCLVDEIKKIIKKKKIDSTDEGFILGLGNRFSTADSLGPITIDKVMVTRHLFELGTNVKDGIRNVSAISPGVMANTGIETYDIITSLIQKIKPKFVVVIDALASSSVSRINKTIQITDTGIHPGSGIGNNRKEISMDTLGIPVIAIGVPTVVESSIIVSDTMEYLFKHLSYIKNHYDLSKLTFGHKKGYLEKLSKETLTEIEKKEVSGILGTLDEIEKLELIHEVLNSIDYNLIVTPKEIDFLIENLSDVIANSINKGLHLAVAD